MCDYFGCRDRAVDKDRRKQNRDLLRQYNCLALVAIWPWNYFLPILCLTHNLYRKQNWLGQVCDCSWHFCHASHWMHSLSLHPWCLNTLGTLWGGRSWKGMPEEESQRADNCTATLPRWSAKVEDSAEMVMQMSEKYHLLMWSVNKAYLLFWDFYEAIKRYFFLHQSCMLHANISISTKKTPQQQ